MHLMALLKAYQMPVQVKQALAYLAEFEQNYSLLYLYRKYFPAHYARSQAPALPQPYQVYSPKEIEFFQLVNKHWFPVPVYNYAIEQVQGEARDHQIMVEAMVPDFWNCAVSDWNNGMQILLVLIGYAKAKCQLKKGENEDNMNVADLPPSLDRLFKPIPNQHPSFELEWDKLIAHCKDKAAPLGWLPLTLEIFDHSVGNCWIDHTEESPCREYVWREEDVLALRDQHKEAAQMMEKAHQLLKWWEKPENLKEVIELWKQCLVTPLRHGRP